MSGRQPPRGYRGGSHQRIGGGWKVPGCIHGGPGQSLAKEVGTVLEALGEYCPGDLLGQAGVWVLPGESE